MPRMSHVRVCRARPHYRQGHVQGGGPGLREALLDAQYDLAEKAAVRHPRLPGSTGRARARRSTAQRVDGPAPHPDPRVRPPTDEERERPEMWRFWRALPPKGKIGIFFGSWYSDADPEARARHDTRDAELDQASSDIAPLRADARRRGRAAPQVLVPPLEEAAEEAAQSSRATRGRAGG